MSKNVEEVHGRIIAEYDRGDNLEVIKARLNHEGYRTKTGAPIYHSYISKVAHEAGCARRYNTNRSRPKANPTGTLAKQAVDTVVQIGASNLSPSLKKELIYSVLAKIA